MTDITELLEAVEEGVEHASGDLIPIVYGELRRLAAYRLAREKPGQTLQPTALVHEAYLRLVGSGASTCANRHHFFCAAGEAMRRILVENARRKQSQKRGGELHRVDMAQEELPAPLPDDELLALHEALDGLEEEDPEAAKLVRLRFFIGMSESDAANVLGVSRRTAGRRWSLARAWLAEALYGETE